VFYTVWVYLLRWFAGSGVLWFLDLVVFIRPTQGLGLSIDMRRRPAGKSWCLRLWRERDDERRVASRWWLMRGGPHYGHNTFTDDVMVLGT
jgi:hypothetical protein